jgi:NTP pyrophosphatase (non-canonical NTP hydrolase)
MKLDEYMAAADETIKDDSCRTPWYLGLGFGGEAGEVLNEIKKKYRDATDDKVFREKLKLEMGDVLWYWVQLCRTFKFNPEEIMQLNIDKLTKRMKDEASGKKRKD